MSAGQHGQSVEQTEPQGFLHLMEAVLRDAAQFMALIAEAMAVLVIAVALLWTAFSMVRVMVRDRLTFKERWGALRLRLGRWLLLALDILIAADILSTAVAPTFTQLGELAVVVLIRVVLDFFLERQINREEKNENQEG